MNRSRAGAVGLAVAVAAALTLSGCSGSSGSSPASAGGAPDRGLAGGPQPAADSSFAEGLAKSTGSAASVDPAALTGRRQVRTGDLSVRVDSVSAAAARVRSLATAAKGFVADEKTSSDPLPTPVPLDKGVQTPVPVPSGEQSSLTLRVPEGALDKVMDQVAGLGTLVSRGQSSSDVTGQYVDTASRLRTQRESVQRVRTLLSKARNLGQVVQIESELSRRQGDLEALEARLAALDDQTTLATLSVNLSPTQAKPVTAPPQGAFVSGLHGGLDALVASVAVALTIVGALLPFALLAALVGLPVLLLLRRRRTQPSGSA